MIWWLRGHTLRTVTSFRSGFGLGWEDCGDERRAEQIGNIDWLIQTPHLWSEIFFVTWPVPISYLPPACSLCFSSLGLIIHCLFSKYWLSISCQTLVLVLETPSWSQLSPAPRPLCLLFHLLGPLFPRCSAWLSSFPPLGLSLNTPVRGQTPSDLTRKKCPFIGLHFSNPFVSFRTLMTLSAFPGHMRNSLRTESFLSCSFCTKLGIKV